jgi:hypothetical protein
MIQSKQAKLFSLTLAASVALPAFAQPASAHAYRVRRSGCSHGKYARGLPPSTRPTRVPALFKARAPRPTMRKGLSPAGTLMQNNLSHGFLWQP